MGTICMEDKMVNHVIPLEKSSEWFMGSSSPLRGQKEKILRVWNYSVSFFKAPEKRDYLRGLRYSEF